MYRFSLTSIGKLEGVHPRLKLLMAVSIKNSPWDFAIESGVRTEKEQKRLYEQGRFGNKGRIVTSKDGIIKRSNHQVKKNGYGYAVDIVVWENGKKSWNERKLKDISKHIKEQAKILGIRVFWGGDWKQLVDMPHYEIM